MSEDKLNELRAENERLQNIEIELHKVVGNLGGQVNRLRAENERLQKALIIATDDCWTDMSTQCREAVWEALTGLTLASLNAKEGK